MKRDKQKLNDSDRLKKVIEALDISASKLATRLGYRSSASIYHIINGINNLSLGMSKKIVKKYPQVSFLYLTQGKGDPILKNNSNQRNILHSPLNNNLNDLYLIPKLLEEQNELLREIRDKLID